MDWIKSMMDYDIKNFINQLHDRSESRQKGGHLKHMKGLSINDLEIFFNDFVYKHYFCPLFQMCVIEDKLKEFDGFHFLARLNHGSIAVCNMNSLLIELETKIKDEPIFLFDLQYNIKDNFYLALFFTV